MHEDIDIIIKEVCNEFEITPKQLFSHTRLREVVVARQVFYYFARKYTTLSLAQIGNSTYNNYGFKRDHATVLHSSKRISECMPYDKYLRSRVENVDLLLQAMFIGSKAVADIIIGVRKELRRITSLETLQMLFQKYLVKTKNEIYERDSKPYTPEVAAKIKAGVLKLAKKN